MSWALQAGTFTSGTQSPGPFTDGATGTVTKAADWQAALHDIQFWGGNVDAGGNTLVNLGASGGVAFWTSPGTKIGIGNSNPPSALTVTRDAAGLVSTPGLAQLAITGASNTADSLWIGFDTTNNCGVIQAGVAGSGWNDLILNPLGHFVGIGTSAPAAQLTVSGIGQTSPNYDPTVPISGGLLVDDAHGAPGDGGVVVFSAFSQAWKFAAIKAILTTGSGNSQGDLVFCTRPNSATANLTEAMRLTAQGNLGLGTSNPQTKLHVIGTVFVGANSSSGILAGDICLSRDAFPTSGAVFFGSAGHYLFFDGTTFNFNPATTNLPSDARLKKNIRALTGGVDIINQLRPIEAEWNGEGHSVKGQRLVSVLAHELQTVLPNAVSSFHGPCEGDETYLNYNPNEVLFQAVLALQQLDERLRKLETKS
jgi:hypothetical protein